MDRSAEAIKFDSIQVNGLDASITLTVPASLVPVLKSVLDALFSLATTIEAKRRFAVAGTSSAFQEQCDEHYKKLSIVTMSEFYKHYTGSNFRQAVSDTKKKLVASGYPVTCGMLEIIIRQEGKKNGL